MQTWSLEGKERSLKHKKSMQVDEKCKKHFNYNTS